MSEREFERGQLRELKFGPEGSCIRWTCRRSPFGKCIYHPPTDPGYFDKCIFCSEPWERK